jgi:hypothetical protein
MTSKNEFKTFLNKDDELPRLAVLQRFKDINRVMTDNFLKQKREEASFKNPQNQRGLSIDGKRKA